MINNYHVDFHSLTIFINEIYDEIKKYGNVDLELDSNTDDSRVEHYSKIFLKKPFNILQPVRMIIGVKSLIDNVEGDYFRDEDVVKLIWSLNHEFVHVEDHMANYINKSVSDDIKNAATVEVIADYIPEFRNYAEKYFPSELKAERDAFIMTKTFFKNHNTGIDYQSVILDRINSDMYQFLQKKCKSYDEIYDCLQDRYEKSFYDLRLSMLWQYPVKSKAARDFIVSPDMIRDILNNPTNGITESNIALKYIAKYHPRQLGAYKCLHDEYLSKPALKKIKKPQRELPKVNYEDDNEVEHEHE